MAGHEKDCIRVSGSLWPQADKKANAATAAIANVGALKFEWFFISTMEESNALHGLRQARFFAFGVSWREMPRRDTPNTGSCCNVERRHDFCYTIFRHLRQAQDLSNALRRTHNAWHSD
jgi:hypothetical protein